MGVLGLLTGVKKFIPTFLQIGAVLMVIGGLLVCCWNCGYYNELGDGRRSYKSMEQTLAGAALASGMIGVVCAVVALAAVVLSFTSLPGMVVTIAYAATLVLCIGEIIPESVIVSKKFGVPPKKMDYLVSDRDYAEFYKKYEKEQEKYIPEGMAWEDEYVFYPDGGSDRVTGLKSRLSDLPGWQSGQSYVVGQYGYPQPVYIELPCVINFKESKYDYESGKKCEDIDLKVEMCLPTWNAKALTASLRRKCEEIAKEEEDAKEEAKLEEELGKLQEAFMEEMSKKPELADLELVEFVEKASEWDSYKDIMEFYSDYYMDMMKEYADYFGDSAAGITVNEVAISIQVIGFVFTLVGVVFTFVMSMLPGGDDAAKPEA